MPLVQSVQAYCASSKFELPNCYTRAVRDELSVGISHCERLSCEPCRTRNESIFKSIHTKIAGEFLIKKQINETAEHLRNAHLEAHWWLAKRSALLYKASCKRVKQNDFNSNHHFARTDAKSIEFIRWRILWTSDSWLEDLNQTSMMNVNNDRWRR